MKRKHLLRKSMILMLSGLMVCTNPAITTGTEEPVRTESVTEEAKASEEAAAEAAEKAAEAAAKAAAEEAAEKAAKEAVEKAAKEAEEKEAEKADEAVKEAETPAAGAAASETTPSETPASEEGTQKETDSEAAPETSSTEEPQPAASTETDAEDTEAGSEAATEKASEENKETEKTKETEKEKPVFKGTVKVERIEKTDLHDGDATTLAAVVTNANLSYEVRWEVQKIKDDDSSWTALGTGNTYVLNVTEENAKLYYRAVLTFGKTGADEAASAKFALPQLKELPKEAAAEETEAPAAEAEETEAEAAEETEAQTEEQEVPDEDAEAEEETEEASPYEDLEVKTINRSRIRMEADGLSEIYGVAPAGTVFKVLGVEGDWVKVEFDGRIGYTYKTNVEGLPEEKPELDEEGNPVPKEKKVTIFSSKWTHVRIGECLMLSSQIEGFEDCEELFYQWMVDKGEGFTEIEGANDPTYYFIADKESVQWSWKLMIYYR